MEKTYQVFITKEEILFLWEQCGKWRKEHPLHEDAKIVYDLHNKIGSVAIKATIDSHEIEKQ